MRMQANIDHLIRTVGILPEEQDGTPWVAMPEKGIDLICIASKS